MPYFRKEEEQALFLFLREVYRLNFLNSNFGSDSGDDSLNKWFDLRVTEQMGFFSGAHTLLFIEAKVRPLDLCYDIRPTSLLRSPSKGSLAKLARKNAKRFEHVNTALDGLSIYARQYYSNNNANKNLNELKDDRPDASLLNPLYYLLAFLCEAFDGLFRKIENKALLARCHSLIYFLSTLHRKKNLYFKKDLEKDSGFTRSIGDLFLYLIAEARKIEKVFRDHLSYDVVSQIPELYSPNSAAEFYASVGDAESIESLCHLTYQVKDPEKLQTVFEMLHDKLFQGPYRVYLKAGDRAVSRYGQVKAFPKGISQMLNLMSTYFLDKPLSLDSLETLREQLVILSEEAILRSSGKTFFWRDPSVQEIYDVFLSVKKQGSDSLEFQDGAVAAPN